MIGWLIYNNLWIYRALYHLLSRSYSKDPNWAHIMDRDVSQTAVEAFFASIGSLRQTDLRPTLGQIDVPVLGMYGSRDNVVDPDQWKLLKAGVKAVRIELFPHAGHFLMLDEPAQFSQRLREFLEEPQHA
jgi:pimeloyl-ACP methyl ester carboxylesterase